MRCRTAVAYTLIELDMVYERADEFDIIHNHCDYFAFPFARRSATPTVTTMHGRLDLAEVRRLNARFPEQPLVSISDAQREALPGANWRPRSTTASTSATTTSVPIPATTSSSSGGSARRSGPIGRSRSRGTPGCA